jgi:hypothetical protein
MVYGIKDQFMFGPALLVSPVTAMSATSPLGLSAGRDLVRLLDRRPRPARR